MFRSVKSRLLFNTVLVTLVAILSVGMVTTFLVNTYFARQEQEYLQLQANRMAPSILEAINSNNLVELQQAVAIGAYVSQVRVQIYDNENRLVADSGSQFDNTYFNPFDSTQPEIFVGAVIDDSGEVLRFSPLISWQSDLAGSAALSLLNPAQLLTPMSSFTTVSDANIVTPLLWDSSTIGYLELSEGPAVGDKISESIWLGLIIGSIAALAAAVLIGLWSARQVVVPLQNLGEAVEAMGDDDLTARAPTSNLLEFDQLADQFNTMAKQLEGTIEKLNEERGILRHTISDAGHEFRTPLTALKTFNTLLEDEVSDSDLASTYVNESKHQIAQMQQITNAILDLSRFESRLSGTNFEWGDLRDPLKSAVHNLQPIIDTKNITLQLDLPTNELSSKFDHVAIQQAISNLISNSVKYSSEDGEITIRLKDQGGAAEISIIDQGAGIPKENLPYIFDRFYRYPSSSEEGSGLGLAICREIVKIHQGDILVDSTVGTGSHFTIRLPINNT